MLRQFVIVAASVLTLLSASAAQGVTPVAPKATNDHTSGLTLTTSAAVRAQADVQIRRLHNLLVNKSGSDASATYDKLEKLQKQLRGEK